MKIFISLYHGSRKISNNHQRKNKKLYLEKRKNNAAS